MSWNKSDLFQVKNKSSDNLISLYSRIPDYSEVKHLGQSDFINALEQLKEEFRQCRANLYNDDICSNNGSISTSSDIDYITERTSKVLNIHSSSGGKSSTKISNTNLSSSRYDPVGPEKSKSNQSQAGDLLSVKGCELHRNPFASSGAHSVNYLHYNKPSRSLSFNLVRDNTRKYNYDAGDGDGLDSGTDTPDSDFSKWSSSPDLYSTNRPFLPPSNVEKRLLQRKTENNSAPSLTIPENDNSTVFKANPVPSHVYKPLYEFIMLKNQRRSQKVRELSKQKLMAQVRPFSFSRETKSINHGLHKPINNNGDKSINSNREQLNNMKPVKPKRGSASTTNFKTINHFRANPAPPRTKALMSAMRLKEQQDYRELKKRLRAEALLKNATLPPSMAARDKRLKLSAAKLDLLIQEYQNSYNSVKDNETSSRNYREQSTDDTTAYTDDDRLSDDSYGNPQPVGARLVALRKIKNFTPFGKSRHSSAASGVFECTSNDNLASRLRIQATRKREGERMKREEEELLKLMRNENRRKKLRDSHIHAWRRAHSYSSSQDIAMRRQLRMAASILERESFVKDMSSMLTRVRSAPLLLEGVRERRLEPCKQHKGDSFQYGDRSNKIKPLRSRVGGGGSSNWMYDRYADEPSETVALAEGTLTNSDNESVGNIDSDEENPDEQLTHESQAENNNNRRHANETNQQDNQPASDNSPVRNGNLVNENEFH